MSLYDDHGRRKYLNEIELCRFIEVANGSDELGKRLGLLLAHTGMRISEACTLTFDAIQPEARVLSVRTLKQRDKGRTREIPLPKPLLSAWSPQETGTDLNVCSGTGFPVSRITAYRQIKAIMDRAGLRGPKACPKGLRHAFGVRAVLANVPLNVLQHWMGHTSMATTAIYTSVIGLEQLEFSDRMWRDRRPLQPGLSTFAQVRER